MVQYFFDVTNGASTFKDAAGATFSSLEDARAHAVLIAGELAADGHHYVGFEVVVADRHGHERVRVAVGRPSD
jgi:predicted 2-oxoglutarate/Fe(II)-dependent dioxygenase YbiX